MAASERLRTDSGETKSTTCGAVRSGTGRISPPAAILFRLDILPFISPHLWFVEALRADDVWDAMGDRTRRAIVDCLAERPLAVGDLANVLPVSQPAVSQHLKVLKAAGLVTERAAGTRRIYRLNPVGVSALRDQLDTFWNRALASYKDIVEQPTEERS
jgi:DNA-binding transcriptional ArsR family regulator